MHPQTTYLLIASLRSIGMSLMATSYVPYLLTDLHISPADVELLNAAFLFSIFFCEIPTGMFADGRGRRWAIRAGLLCCAIGKAIYACATGFWSVLLAEMIIGLSFAFLSGALTAWVVDALQKREPERIKTVFATEVIFTAGGFLVGSQIGHLASLWSFRAPWILSAVVHLGALLVAARFLTDEGEPTNRVTERQALTLALQRIRALPGLRWGAYASMAFGFVIPFNHFWSPYFRTFIPETIVGIAWIPLYAALGISGWLVKRGMLLDRHADRTLTLALLVAGISLAAMGMTNQFSGVMLCAMVHEIARGIFRPHMELFFQRQFASAYRATAGSIISFIQSCGYGIILLSVWLAMRGIEEASRSVIAALFLWCGGILSVLATGLFLLRPRTVATQPVPSSV